MQQNLRRSIDAANERRQETSEEGVLLLRQQALQLPEQEQQLLLGQLLPGESNSPRGCFRFETKRTSAVVGGVMMEKKIPVCILCEGNNGSRGGLRVTKTLQAI